MKNTKGEVYPKLKLSISGKEGRIRIGNGVAKILGKALVLAMARNTAIDTIRKRKPAIPLDEAEAAVFTDDIGSRLEALDMLALLDVDEKQLVMLRLYSELPYKEAAWIMGTSVAAVQKKYQRAIKKLKAFYKEEIPYEAEQN